MHRVSGVPDLVDCRCAYCKICVHDHRGWRHQWAPSNGSTDTDVSPVAYPGVYDEDDPFDVPGLGGTPTTLSGIVRSELEDGCGT